MSVARLSIPRTKPGSRLNEEGVGHAYGKRVIAHPGLPVRSGSSSSNGSGGTTTTGETGTPLGTQRCTITAAASEGINTVRHTYPYQVTVQYSETGQSFA